MLCFKRNKHYTLSSSFVPVPVTALVPTANSSHLSLPLRGAGPSGEEVPSSRNSWHQEINDPSKSCGRTQRSWAPQLLKRDLGVVRREEAGGRGSPHPPLEPSTPSSDDGRQGDREPAITAFCPSVICSQLTGHQTHVPRSFLTLPQTHLAGPPAPGFCTR